MCVFVLFGVAILSIFCAALLLFGDSFVRRFSRVRDSCWRGFCFAGGGSCSVGLSFGLPETLIQIGVAELGFVGILGACFRFIGRGFCRGLGFLSGYPMPGSMCGGNVLVLFWGIRIRMV